MEAVWQDVSAFQEGAEQFDDITMLAVKWNETEWEEKNGKAESEMVCAFAEFMEEQMKRHDISRKTILKIQMAADEILSNICNYSTASEIKVKFRVEETPAGRNVVLGFEDDGVPFNPLKTSNTKSTETTDNVETKEITLTEITWKLNVEESDKDTFDSSEERDGYCYVYIPVMPEKDEDGNTLVLGENVDVPAIYVRIGEGEYKVSLIDEKSGTCGDNLTWTLDNGTLTISGTGAMTVSSQAPWYNDIDSITKVVIENGVTSIGARAFLNCTSLESVAIPNSVTKIEELAFSGCEKLESIDIPNGVTKIGEMAFYYCESLTNIAIPDSVTYIYMETFYGCSSLTSVMFGVNSKLTKIYTYAFYNCTSLKNIAIPDSVNKIDNYAFLYCTSLESVTIPNSVTAIGSGAFYECSSLTSITYGGSKKQWEKIDIGSDNTALTNDKITYKKLDIILDLNSGTYNGETAFIIEKGTALGEGKFPTVPSRTGYTFDKWVDKAGNEVTKDTIFSTDTTVIAQ